MEDLYKEYNRQLYKRTNSNQVILANSKSEIDPALLGVGSFQGNLELVGGNMQSPDFVSGSTGWKISNDGSIEAADLTLTGGTIKYNKTSFTDSTNAGYWIGSNGLYFGSASDASYIKYDISAATFVVKGALTANSGSIINGQYLTSNTVTGIKLKIGNQSWSHDLVFSSTDADTVAWALGTITMADGTTTYSIDAGNTSNMTARTYIYLDITVSTTVLQITTTAGSAVGDGKILIAVAENSTTQAGFQVYGGIGGIAISGGDIENLSISETKITDLAISTPKLAAGAVTAAKITAGTITANEIAANTILAANIAAGTITTTELNVSQLSAISANLGTVTAGSITGVTITGGTIRTASSGARVEMSGSTNKLSIYDSSGLVGSMYGYGSTTYISSNSFVISTSGNVDIFSIVASASKAQFSVTVVPEYDNTWDLGGDVQYWRNLYLAGIAYIDTLSLSSKCKLPVGTNMY